MHKIERAIEELIQGTENQDIHWDRPNNTGHFKAEVEGQTLRIYQNGTLSIENWKHQSELCVELYKSVRMQQLPQFVDEFIDSIL